MFKLINVTKTYKRGKIKKEALHSISLTLPSKGLVFIIGKSGSGKSTLLNILSGLDSFTSGEIYYNDFTYKKKNTKKFDKLHAYEFGFVFQDYCLIEELSVKDNIALGTLKNESECKREINNLLELVGLKKYGNKLAKELSGGEKQRIALARALIKKPNVVFCDEPTGNLDMISSEKVLKVLKKASKNALIIVVTHNIDSAYLYGDRIISLNDGIITNDETIYNEGKSQKLYSIPPSLYTDSNEINKINELIQNKEIEGITSRYSQFEETNYVNDEPNKYKIKRKKGECSKTISKLFSKKWYITTIFVILASLMLALYSVCASFKNFNNDDFILENLDTTNSNALVVQKTGVTENGNFSFDSVKAITDNDMKLLQENYTGNIYKIYNYSIHIAGTEYLKYDNHIKPSLFYKFYAQESRGLVVASESFVNKILQTEKIEFLAKAKKEEPFGIYITDYLADSYYYWKPINNHNYAEVLGYLKLSEDGATKQAYINGVIKTNYRENTKNIRELFMKNNVSSVNDILMDQKCKNELNYLYSAASYAYSFDPDFKTAYDSELLSNNSMYFRNVTIKSKDTKYSLGTKTIGYSSKLNDNEVLMTSATLKAVFGEALTIEALTNNLENLGAINLTSTSSQINYNQIFFNENVTIKIKESNKDLLNTYSVGNIIVSENVYRKYHSMNLIVYATYMDNIEDVKENMQKLSKSRLVPFDMSYDAILKVTEAIASFSSVFRVITDVCLLLVIILLVVYVFFIVRSQKYNIGLLKSLGTSNLLVTGNFLGQIAMFFMVTASLYGTFYSVLININNKVLKSALKSKLYYKAFIGDIVRFNNLHYMNGLALLFGITVMVSILYLLYLISIKPISIIKSRD
ncbi:MAG: ABC transporter ATP-binding protein [Acholeplasmataceae bacterium]|nr:ABC transporter ATP-binding protein [Acholeplasmataceae bacterium]